MKKEFLQLVSLVKNWSHTLKIMKSREFLEEREKAQIIRLVHSIEKGLCLENIRMGFGIFKLKAIFDLCEEYAEKFGSNSICIKMAHDAIEEYIEFHNKNGYKSSELFDVCERFHDFPYEKEENGEKFGGTFKINKQSNISFENLETFFAQRHSVREFKKGNICNEDIVYAVKAAQYAPSACNRQAVRAYVISSEDLCALYGNKMDGIGGFAESANKFILITGKVSAYEMGEYDQHIVSASIFATYLMLALYSKKLGSCVIQRPLHYSKQWANISNKCGIPEDEQLVLMMAVGIMKDECSTPVSKRFPIEDILRFK